MTIQAQDSWQLEVVGHPGTLSGAPLDKSGNRTFPWDGAVNGTTLPDGKYTLRLTAGTEVKTAEVSIDTQAPEIKALTYLAVDNNAAMEVSANILDKVADGASGIDEASITVSLQENNVAFGTRNFESTLGSFSQKLDVEKLQEFFSGIPRIPGAKKPLMVEARDLAGNKVSAELKDASNIKKETLSLNFDSGYHVAAVNDNPNNPIIRPLLAQRIVHNSELFTGDAQIIWNYQKRGSENGRVVFKHDWRTGRNRIVNLSFEFNCKDNKYNFIQNGFIPLPEGQYFSTYETAWGDILNSHAYRIENRIAYKDPTLIEMHGILFDKLVKKDWLDFFGGNGLKEVSKNWKLVFGPLIDSKMKHPEQIDFAWASYNIVLKREFNATIQDKSYLFVDDEDGRGPWTAYVQYEGDVDSHPVVIRTIREYDIRTNTIIEHVIDAFVKN